MQFFLQSLVLDLKLKDGLFVILDLVTHALHLSLLLLQGLLVDRYHLLFLDRGLALEHLLQGDQLLLALLELLFLLFDLFGLGDQPLLDGLDLCHHVIGG